MANDEFSTTQVKQLEMIVERTVEQVVQRSVRGIVVAAIEEVTDPHFRAIQDTFHEQDAKIDALARSNAVTQKNVVAIAGSLATTQKNVVAIAGSLATTQKNVVAIAGSLAMTNKMATETQKIVTETQQDVSTTKHVVSDIAATAERIEQHQRAAQNRLDHHDGRITKLEKAVFSTP